MGILYHRFPNKTKVFKTGEFKQISFKDLDEINGFIVSSFDSKKEFVFVEDEKAKKGMQFFFSKEEPFVISKDRYLLVAKKFKESIIDSKIDKAILSRVKHVPLTNFNLESIFENLCEAYPNALVYLMSSEQFGTWIGATPEILLNVNAGQVQTMALAGTKKSKTENWTNKEIDEQAYVTQRIVEVANQFKKTYVDVSPTYTYEAGPIFHLRTNINFDIENKNLKDLLNELHPTPAVAGLPVEQATDLIHKEEIHQRDLYTGFLGYISEEHTSLYVNLRCAQIFEKSAYLYLGGGFTSESSVNQEWEETENKSLTLTEVFLKNS